MKSPDKPSPQMPSEKATKKSRNCRYKVVLWCVGVLLLLYVGTSGAVNWMLKKSIEKVSHEKIVVEYQKLHYQLATNKLTINGLELNILESDSSQLSFPKITIEELGWRGLQWYHLLKHKKIDLTEIYFSDMNIHAKMPSENNAEIGPPSLTNDSTVIEKFRQFVEEQSLWVQLKQLAINDLNLFIYRSSDTLPTMAVQNIHLVIDSVLLNDSTVNQDHPHFFQRLEWTIGKNRWSIPSQPPLLLAFDTLLYSSTTQQTIAKNLSLKTGQDLDSLFVNASFLLITNPDFQQLFLEKTLHLDTLKIAQSNIQITSTEPSPSKTQTKPKKIQELIPISLKHIILQDNSVDFQRISSNQPTLRFQGVIDLQLDDFSLNSQNLHSHWKQLFAQNYDLQIRDINTSQDGEFQGVVENLHTTFGDHPFLQISNAQFQQLNTEKPMDMLAIQLLRMAPFDIDKSLTTKKINLDTLSIAGGEIRLRNPSVHSPQHHQTDVNFQLPTNPIAQEINIQHVDIHDFNFKTLSHKPHTEIKISDIAWQLYSLHLVDSVAYSLIHNDFCKRQTLQIGKSQLPVNQGFYQISWDHFTTDFDQQIRCSHFSMHPTIPIEQLLKEAVILPSMLLDVDVNTLNIKQLDLPQLVNEGNLQATAFFVENPHIQLFKTEFSSQKSTPLNIYSTTIDSLSITNGCFRYSDAQNQLQLQQYQLDVSEFIIPNFENLEEELECRNFVLTIDTQTFTNQNVALETTQIRMDHQNELFQLASLSLHQTLPLPNERNIHLNIKQLKLEKPDFHSILSDRVLFAETLSVASASLQGNSTITRKNNEVKPQKDSLASPVLQHILIKNFSLPHLSTHLSLTNDSSENFQLSLFDGFVKAQNINWMPDMQGFPHQGKMEIGIKNLQGTAKNAQKSISIDSLNFNSDPQLAKLYHIEYQDNTQKSVCPEVVVEQVKLFHLDLDSLFVAQRFLSEKLLLDGGEVTLNLTQRSTQDNTQITHNQPMTRDKYHQLFTENLIGDLVKQLYLNNFRIKILQDNREQIVQLHQGILDANNGHIVRIGSCNFLINNNLTNVGFKNLLINTQYRRVVVDSCYYTPTLSKEDWSPFFGYQKDWTKFTIRSLLLEGVDFAELLQPELHRVPFVRIHQMVLEDYRDKRLPFPADQHPGMPQEILQKIPVPFLIDSLLISSSSFTYEEQVPHALSSGKIFFTRSLIAASNITNAASRRHLPMRLSCSAYLMDAAKMTAQLQFTLNDTMNAFQAAAQLEPIAMPLLNPVLENLAFLTIKSGFCNGITMDFHGNKYYALGSMSFIYNGFRIGIIDKNRMAASAGTNFLAFLANTFVVKRSNPSFYFFPRSGIMYFEPDPQKSIFNYFFKTALSGIKHTIGLSEQKSKHKGTATYNTYTQERKTLIKKHREQKKLEKKMNKN